MIQRNTTELIMKTQLRTNLVLVLAVTLGTGCASLSSIVKKPEIQQVKKIALISITAPQKVPHKNGKGQVPGWGTANRQAIADQTLSTYTAEFKKLGWEVIPTSQLSALPVYKENFAPKISKADNTLGKTLNTLSTMDAENTYFSPTGLSPIVWEDDKSKGDTLRLDLANLSLEKTKTLKTKMQEVASQSGADAAVLVQADYCYDDGALWVGHAGSGTGSAVLTGASAVYAITPKGVEVIKMKRIQAACGGTPRVVSDSSTAMVKGHLLYSDETIQKMFLEVARKSAAESVRQIQDAIKK